MMSSLMSSIPMMIAFAALITTSMSVSDTKERLKILRNMKVIQKQLKNVMNSPQSCGQVFNNFQIETEENKEQQITLNHRLYNELMKLPNAEMSLIPGPVSGNAMSANFLIKAKSSISKLAIIRRIPASLSISSNGDGTAVILGCYLGFRADNLRFAEVCPGRLLSGYEPNGDPICNAPLRGRNGSNGQNAGCSVDPDQNDPILKICVTDNEGNSTWERAPIENL